MAKIIILNGPPGCGKDTIANEALARNLVDSTHSFKAPMFEIIKATLGPYLFEKFMQLYNERATKEKPLYWLNNMSPRQFVIYISEKFVKPALGSEHFGYLAGEAIGASGDAVIMSDGGFPDEVRSLASWEGHHCESHEIHVVRLYREGFTFEGDSRNYIHGLEDEFDNVYEHNLSIQDGDVDGAILGLQILCGISVSTDL